MFFCPLIDGLERSMVLPQNDIGSISFITKRYVGCVRLTVSAKPVLQKILPLPFQHSGFAQAHALRVGESLIHFASCDLRAIY